MKNLLLILCLYLIPAFACAETVQAKLDLTELDGGINAGMVDVEIEVEASTTRAAGKTYQNIGTNDGEDYCRTILEFEVGRMRIQYRHSGGEWASWQEVPLVYFIEHYNKGSECDDTNLAGAQTGYLVSDPWYPEVSLPMKRFHGFADIYLAVNLLMPDWQTTLQVTRENGVYYVDPVNAVKESNLRALVDSGAKMYYGAFGLQINLDGSGTHVPLLISESPVHFKTRSP